MPEARRLSGPVFASRPGGPLPTRVVEYLLERTGCDAELARRLRPHMPGPPSILVRVAAGRPGRRRGLSSVGCGPFRLASLFEGETGNARGGEATAARNWFLGQVGLDTAWSFACFGRCSPLAGVAVIVPLRSSIIARAGAAMQINRSAGWLRLPPLAG